MARDILRSNAMNKHRPERKNERENEQKPNNNKVAFSCSFKNSRLFKSPLFVIEKWEKTSSTPIDPNVRYAVSICATNTLRWSGSQEWWRAMNEEQITRRIQTKIKCFFVHRICVLSQFKWLFTTFILRFLSSCCSHSLHIFCMFIIFAFPWNGAWSW